MSAVFAVDSARLPTDLVQPGLTVWQDVVDWAGAPPRAWGGYLGTGGGAATPLNAAAVAFLHGQHCAVVPIYNDATATSVASGYAAGCADARRAIALAQALGVPAGIYIWGDVEYGWALTPGWIEGWCDTWRPTPFGGSGGLYGNLDTPAFGRPYCEARTDPAATPGTRANVQRLELWAARWVSQGTTAAGAPPWNPAAPPGGAAAVRAWQYSGGAFGGVADLDELDARLLDSGLWLAA